MPRATRRDGPRGSAGEIDARALFAVEMELAVGGAFGDSARDPHSLGRNPRAQSIETRADSDRGGVPSSRSAASPTSSAKPHAGGAAGGARAGVDAAAGDEEGKIRARIRRRALAAEGRDAFARQRRLSETEAANAERNVGACRRASRKMQHTGRAGQACFASSPARKSAADQFRRGADCSRGASGGRGNREPGGVRSCNCASLWRRRGQASLCCAATKNDSAPRREFRDDQIAFVIPSRRGRSIARDCSNAECEETLANLAVRHDRILSRRRRKMAGTGKYSARKIARGFRSVHESVLDSRPSRHDPSHHRRTDVANHHTAIGRRPHCRFRPGQEIRDHYHRQRRRLHDHRRRNELESRNDFSEVS